MIKDGILSPVFDEEKKEMRIEKQPNQTEEQIISPVIGKETIPSFVETNRKK